MTTTIDWEREFAAWSDRQPQHPTIPSGAATHIDCGTVGHIAGCEVALNPEFEYHLIVQIEDSALRDEIDSTIFGVFADVYKRARDTYRQLEQQLPDGGWTVHISTPRHSVWQVQNNGVTRVGF